MRLQYGYCFLGCFNAASVGVAVWAFAVKVDGRLVRFVFYWTGGSSVAFCT